MAVQFNRNVQTFHITTSKRVYTGIQNAAHLQRVFINWGDDSFDNITTIFQWVEGQGWQGISKADFTKGIKND